jgi:signal transduction histidine kinase/HAMP domain-containing protein
VRCVLLRSGAAAGAAKVNSHSLRHSIGTKIFVAFLAMGAIVGALGASGYWVLSSAGDMVTTTYDGPLMAINYARAASVDFVQMEQAVLRRKLAPKSEHPAIDQNIDDLTGTFFDDLDVAQDRLTANDERAAAKQIRALVKDWQAQWKKSEHADSDPALDTLDAKILDRFDFLIELNTDHSFIGRRKAVWSIGYFKYALVGVTGLALVLSFIITLLLSRRIMRPLSSAVSAANRIAQGEFETPIPQAGEDETGILLKSMTAMQANIRDMMEREKTRAESAESRLAHALETSQEGVVLVATDGRVVMANSMMRQFFPSAAGKMVVGADFAEISQAAEDNFMQKTKLPTPAELGIGRGARSLGGAERQLKDGRWIRSTGSRAADGSLIFFVSDFTAVKEREENFRRATAAAEAASAAKTRFLANMSHELRTPLNAIIGFSEIISGQIFGALGNSKYLEYAGDILRSGRNLLGVINSVLEISKSENGKQSLVGEPIDLRFVLGDCATLMGEQALAGQVAFRLDELPEPLFVFGDESKLRQAILNLMSNAVKFTDPSGQVAVDAHLDGEQVVVQIADTGIGMSAADIEVALTPFGQVDNRLERKYEGTGLGLPLAKSLIELHGGKLEIESAPGVGTTVRIHFPIPENVAGETPLAVAS